MFTHSYLSVMIACVTVLTFVQPRGLLVWEIYCHTTQLSRVYSCWL